MTRQLTFRPVPPKPFDDPSEPMMLDVGPLLMFVVRGKVPPETAETLSLHVSSAFPDRRTVVVLLGEGQEIEVFEEEYKP